MTRAAGATPASEPTGGRRARRLVLYSPNAGSLTEAVMARLRTSFVGFDFAELDYDGDFRTSLAPRALVVVAGGDGSVSHACRKLAGTRHRLAILPLGTFNNFARALGIPRQLSRAIALARTGHARGVTLGKANDHYFLEASAIGVFGNAISLGEKAKEGQLSSMGRELRALAGAKVFQYQITGDFDASGHARSLVFANTPTTGSRIPLGESRPTDPFLELAVGIGRTRGDVVRRAIASALLDGHEPNESMSIRFQRLTVSTKPRVDIYVDQHHIGRTPLVVTADVRALKVVLP